MITTSVYWGADYMISALGFGTEENARQVVAYQSGIKEHSFGDNHFLAAAIDWSKIPQRENCTQLENLSICALENLQKQVVVDFASGDLRVFISTTKGNIDLLANDLNDERAYLSSFAEKIQSYFGLKCKPEIVSNACISGISAQIVATRAIEEGRCRHAIVLGADLLSEFVVTGFQSFKSVSAKVCRPYDAARDGLSMGEACGAIFLTSDQTLAGEQPVQILGGSITNDANHISGPSRTGDGLHFVIENALNESKIERSDIAFVSAHGTATVYNDEMESKALALSHLSDVPTNSVKPYFGHTLGACGVIESILAVWQLRHKLVFGTMGFEELGTPMPLHILAKHSALEKGSCCLKIASGFGGCNAAMVLRLGTNTVAKTFGNEAHVVKSIELSFGADFAERIREEYRALDAPNMKFFKMDDLCKLGYIAAEKLLKDVDLPSDSTRTTIVLCNRATSLDTDRKHQQLLNNGDPASPAIFVYTLPNIVSGEICIRHHIQGENTFFVGADVEQYARTLIARNVADYVICGTCEVDGNVHFAKFDLLQKA